MLDGTMVVDINDDAHVDRGNEILVRELINEVPAAMGIRAAKYKIDIGEEIPRGRLEDIALNRFDVSSGHQPFDHALRDGNLWAADIGFHGAHNPIEIGDVQIVGINQQETTDAKMG